MTSRFTFRPDPAGLARFDRAVEDALADAAGFLLDEANKTVPHMDGILAASGFTDGDALGWIVAYDTPYARRQHEEMGWHHPGGRRAKWLERTFAEQGPRVREFIAEQIRRAL